jgi:murein DD-endopeptidase MepM/ murein hydrolase activator NlpD
LTYVAKRKTLIVALRRMPIHRALLTLPVLALSAQPLASAAPMPDSTLETVIHWETSLRDLVRSVATWTDRLPCPIPDLSIVTTEPVPNTESSGFGWRDDPIRHTQRFHSGTDFRADPGTPVLAAGDGIVSFTGRHGGYGNCIFVDHGGGVVTLYGHLRKIETKVGAAVTAGSRIGQVGSTGRATGPHLHFEIRLDGRPVDPVLAMTIAEIERQAPQNGQLAAFALSPELQSKAKDTIDTARPERPSRTKRAQVLW